MNRSALLLLLVGLVVPAKASNAVDDDGVVWSRYNWSWKGQDDQKVLEDASLEELHDALDFLYSQE
uniref:Uncharacterized protein n=1 Tax=Ciona intestinalis TaxID=7719 RepID=F6QBR1_CIOIN